MGIERKKVDLDAMMLVVMGKGAKERTVPFSQEMRKVLFRHIQQHDSRLLSCSRSGSRLIYRNAYREIAQFCKRAGLSVKVHPHLLRHQFAVSYIRQGGDVYRLSRLLGHTAVTTTQIYLRSMGIEDIREGIDRLSPLTQ